MNISPDSGILFSRIIANLAVTFAEEKIDNPYAKAALAPVVENLVQSLLGMPSVPSPPLNPSLEDFSNKAREQILSRPLEEKCK